MFVRKFKLFALRCTLERANLVGSTHTRRGKKFNNAHLLGLFEFKREYLHSVINSLVLVLKLQFYRLVSVIY